MENYIKTQFKMKNLLFLWAFLSLNVCLYAQKTESTGEYCAVDTIKGSPARELSKNIGKNQITIKYYSPGVKGRVIWGGLVAYNKVWVTGAHYATNIEFKQDVKINGKVVKAGKYAFFTIPNKKEWTLIINKNWEQHLADEYDEKDDVLRLSVKPEKLKTEVSRLAYYIVPQSEQAGKMAMAWEKVKVSFEVQNAE